MRQRFDLSFSYEGTEEQADQVLDHLIWLLEQMWMEDIVGGFLPVEDGDEQKESGSVSDGE